MHKGWVVLAVADVRKQQPDHSSNKGVCKARKTHTFEVMDVQVVNFSIRGGGEVTPALRTSTPNKTSACVLKCFSEHASWLLSLQVQLKSKVINLFH